MRKTVHFDLTDMRLLVAIAEANSLTRGAERCHLSAAAVSVRIKNLEEAIGARLLYRSSQGVTLTPPGQAFVHHARAVLGQIEHLRSDLQEYGEGVKGHLRVFASITAMAEFLPPVLSRYLATHRDVSIDLRERPSGDIVRAVTEGQTDLGIVSGPVRTEGLEVLPWRSDRLVLVTPLEHPLAGHGTVSFTDTLEHDHVGLQEGTGLHAFLTQKAMDVGRAFKLRIQAGSFEVCCRMIAADVGLGVMPESAAHRYREQLPIQILELSDAWSLRRLQLCARSFELLPGFARELVEMLQADAAGESGGPD
ncbi:LysR substrate-binding domain-containing protein [Azohydromonas lata]|uniref:LysR substrate-binding domain-containing protein n=1 Tax=Azohydromonas lata TaxID=45677 RepID=A0ABU5IG51_9BURK|nr:LysR substrate-binding domain-containing protein [Azohydromonas lata]MDZ5457928.1 LysR substrate-binding domain-containing protein [Azohydromonas lata]